MPYDRELVERVLAEARGMVLEEIERIIVANRQTGYGPLYDLVADYPFREGKGLRPAILLSAARAAGGRVDDAQVSAAALELYHNAFLVHDDVEDGSDYRRGKITMLRAHGAAIAVNVGDATNVLAMQLLLENVGRIGVHKEGLLVLREVERMARESVEGQAMKPQWIADRRFDLTDQDYIRMAYKKTCWYTVSRRCESARSAATRPESASPWPPTCSPSSSSATWPASHSRSRTTSSISRRTTASTARRSAGICSRASARSCSMTSSARRLRRRGSAPSASSRRRARKRVEDVAWLFAAMQDAGSLAYGHSFAEQYASTPSRPIPGRCVFRGNNDRRFLREMLRFVVERVR